MRTKLLILSILMLATLPVLGGEEATVDGVLHVRNGAEATNGVETWKLNELWRVGGEDDEENLFGLVSQVAIGDDGTVYVLDTQLSEVAVFSPGGERLNTLSREGDGPGETRMPADLLFLPDGTLGLVQVFPGKITKIDLEGNPAGIIDAGGDPTSGGFIQFFDVKTRGEELIIGGVKILRDEGIQNRVHFVSSFSQEGAELTNYAEHTTTLDFQDPKVDEADQYSFDFRHWALDAEGRLYVAPMRNTYELHVYNPDGSIDRIIERQYDSHKRTDEEVALTKARIEAQIRAPIEIPVTVENTEPDISAVIAGPDGNIWVDSSKSFRDQADGILKTWDVFAPGGDFVKQVAIQVPGDGEEDLLVFASPERAVLITGFTSALRVLQGGGGLAEEEEEEPEPMKVIYYEVDQG